MEGTCESRVTRAAWELERCAGAGVGTGRVRPTPRKPPGMSLSASARFRDRTSRLALRGACLGVSAGRARRGPSHP